MKLEIEASFEIHYWKHRGEEITTLDNPLETYEKALELSKEGVFVREIIVIVKISNCIFKRTFHTLPYHSLRFHDFKNFKHAFELYFS
ncbi:MAG: hypothetical protein PHR56_09570 [Dehalococcoidales bacterium]|nr:hypothetical protein [Dehalococcoidales bacterium]